MAFLLGVCVDVVVTLALGVMVLAAITQIVVGGLYLVLGQGDARRQGVRKLVVGGALVLLLVLLGGLPACAPLSTGGTASTVEPAAVQSIPVPDWAAYPVGQWLNMDWDLWSCPRARGC